MQLHWLLLVVVNLCWIIRSLSRAIPGHILRFDLKFLFVCLPVTADLPLFLCEVRARGHLFTDKVMEFCRWLMHLTLASHADVIAQDLGCRHVFRLHRGGHIRCPNVRDDVGALLNLNLLIDLCLPRFHVIGVIYGLDIVDRMELRLLNVLVHEALHRRFVSARQSLVLTLMVRYSQIVFFRATDRCVELGLSYFTHHQRRNFSMPILTVCVLCHHKILVL